MKNKKLPWISLLMLVFIVGGCILADVIGKTNFAYMDTDRVSLSPGKGALFGTDMMGRDLFSLIWHGGRVSLTIGFLSGMISTTMAVIYGCISGFFSDYVDEFLMRLADILLSIPGLLLVIFLQAILGKASIVSLSIVIGLTGWFSMAKVVRTEVKRFKASEFVIASKCMGGSFLHIVWHHFLPNLLPSIMFMIVMNIRGAIVTESTLSFMGLGLPIQVISWGSLLTQAERCLTTGAWWIFMIPGLFLVALVLSLTNIGNFVRKIGVPQTWSYEK